MNDQQGEERREASSVVNVEDVRPDAPMSLIASDRDEHVEVVDTVAGSEFVDDRIRLRE